MPSGGDCREIRWANHPTVPDGRYLPKSGEGSTYDLGGYKVDDSDTNIDAGANFIITSQIKPWMFSVDNIAWDMIKPQRQELESLQAIANSHMECDWTFTNVNNITYSGHGIVVGDIQGNGKDSTIAFKAMGSGILQQI